jgi:hypothetical protein
MDSINIGLPRVVDSSPEILVTLIENGWIVTIKEESSCNGMLNGIFLLAISWSVRFRQYWHDTDVVMIRWSLRKYLRPECRR